MKSIEEKVNFIGQESVIVIREKVTKVKKRLSSTKKEALIALHDEITNLINQLTE